MAQTTERSKLRITLTDGKPQRVDGLLITVRRKRGRRYTVVVEEGIGEAATSKPGGSQLTSGPPVEHNPISR